MSWGLDAQIKELREENQRLREALEEAIVNIPHGNAKDYVERERQRLVVKRLQAALDRKC